VTLPPWAEHRTYLTAAQVALILGFVGAAGQFDEEVARLYVRRHGLKDLKRLMAREPKFPRPHHPHGDEGRPYWLTREIASWVDKQGRWSPPAKPSALEAERRTS